MKDACRLAKLLESLQKEIWTTRPGSNEGQFPILDLLGNLRDEAAASPELAPLQKLCAEAWEKVVVIIEAGKPFDMEDVAWLMNLPPQIGKFVKAAKKPAAEPTESPAPAAPETPSQPASPAQPVASSPASPEEESQLTLNIENDGDLLREFITESREHLDNIEQGVLVLENNPKDAETLNTIFRAFHTFKGSAGFLNLTPVNRLAHILESLLDLARQGKLIIDGPVIDLILRGRDVLKQFVDEIEGQINGSRSATNIDIPTAPIKAEAQAIIDRVNSGAPASAPVAPPPEAPKVEPPPAAVPVQEPAEPARSEAPAPAAEKPPTPPVAPAKPAAPEAAPAPAAAAASRGSERSTLVKVDTGKLDSLLDLVGEMVIAQSLVSQDLTRLANLNPQFARNMSQLGRITKELQRVSMSMRMVPIRGLFQKMARVVRDIGAKQHKRVQLVTSGEDTELDRSVVEELNDPLLHMIRNSMDHGIEPADVRAAKGKPEMGTIHLRAYHQGGNIVLEIADDGAGLNRERILDKAVQRGITSASNRLADEEVFGFIFAPGFSTAAQITDLSGRGVGLDVVQRNIMRLRGSIDISSTLGQGAVFKISLPLTLAIIDGLIVKVGDERYIIPTLSVRESFRPRADMITRVQGRAEVVNVRGRLIPLLRLHDLFGISTAVKDPTEGIIIVAQSGASFQCLLVDTLLHKQEVVIKNLNDIMIHKNRCLAGAAILGDGRVGLILDVNSLVHHENQAFAKAA